MADGGDLVKADTHRQAPSIQLGSDPDLAAIDIQIEKSKKEAELFGIKSELKEKSRTSNLRQFQIYGAYFTLVVLALLVLAPTLWAVWLTATVNWENDPRLPYAQFILSVASSAAVSCFVSYQVMKIISKE